MLWEYGFLAELSQFPALRGLRSAPAGNIWLWIPISMCLGQFSPRADIRFHKSVASMPQSQKTVKTRREGECRSPGMGCLPPWQTNPPNWLVISADEAGEGNRELKMVRADIVSMCLQAKLTVFKCIFQWVIPTDLSKKIHTNQYPSDCFI